VKYFNLRIEDIDKDRMSVALMEGVACDAAYQLAEVADEYRAAITIGLTQLGCLARKILSQVAAAHPAASCGVLVCKSPVQVVLEQPL
jgi:hypothetical protein